VDVGSIDWVGDHAPKATCGRGVSQSRGDRVNRIPESLVALAQRGSQR
jgi:hypothetical protein